MMFRMFKRLLILALIVALGIGIWSLFALWTGIYSVYSYPPSKSRPEGATLIVSREPKEPMFNSPDYIPPKPKPVDTKGGVGFGPLNIKSVKPVESRTIFTLPYVQWAYEKSLTEKQLDALKKGKLKQRER